MSYLDMAKENKKRIKDLKKKLNAKIKPVEFKAKDNKIINPPEEVSPQVEFKTVGTIIRNTDGSLSILFKEKGILITSKILSLTIADNTILKYL